jgi:hypothetical protein
VSQVRSLYRPPTILKPTPVVGFVVLGSRKRSVRVATGHFTRQVSQVRSLHPPTNNRETDPRGRFRRSGVEKRSVRVRKRRAVRVLGYV